MEAALILFLVMYVLLLAIPKWRAYIAMACAAAFVILGILPVGHLFIESKMPARLADMLIGKVPNMKWAIIVLAFFAGLISAFVDNVATVLIVVPVALNISRKLGVSPVYSIIAIAISSNLQGAATLVGDTTSILLGGHANMNFMDFFVYKGKPGLFWVVQISAIAATAILLVVFRKETNKIHIEDKTPVSDYFPTILLLGVVVALIVASFIPHNIVNINGYICMAFLLVGVVRTWIRAKDKVPVVTLAKEIDYFTLLLLAGLFIVIAGIAEAGVIDAVSRLFVDIGGNSLFAIYTLLVWASVLFSAFIDNIPYIAAMLPVVTGIASLMNVDPTILYFGLLSGATLGGNLTPIGASANITALGILRKQGYEVKTSTFMKISVPFTLTAVGIGYGLIWLIWR